MERREQPVKTEDSFSRGDTSSSEHQLTGKNQRHPVELFGPQVNEAFWTAAFNELQKSTLDNPWSAVNNTNIWQQFKIKLSQNSLW